MCEAVTSRGEILNRLTPFGPPWASAGLPDDQEERIAASSTDTCGQAGADDGCFLKFTGGGVVDLTHTPDPAISKPGTAVAVAGEEAGPTTRPESLRLPADRLERERWSFSRVVFFTWSYAGTGRHVFVLGFRLPMPSNEYSVLLGSTQAQYLPPLSPGGLQKIRHKEGWEANMFWWLELGWWE